MTLIIFDIPWRMTSGFGIWPFSGFLSVDFDKEITLLMPSNHRRPVRPAAISPHVASSNRG